MAGGELLTPILTSVTAGPKLRHVFERYRPDIVFHAAAYKHVPMLEMHSDEAVFVNVKGTLNVAQCAAEYGCERFASTLAWAYWQSAGNCMSPAMLGLESSSISPAAFRALLVTVLGPAAQSTTPKRRLSAAAPRAPRARADRGTS